MSYLSSLDSKFTYFGLMLEASCKAARSIPQYKYGSVPVYKFCVGKVGPAAATAISFFISDLIFHQMLSKAIACGISTVSENVASECRFSISLSASLYWVPIAIPIIYVKYKRSQNPNDPNLRQLR